MYVRTISRKNKDGSVTTYVQLADNVWDPENGMRQGQCPLHLRPEQTPWTWRPSNVWSRASAAFSPLKMPSSRLWGRDTQALGFIKECFPGRCLSAPKTRERLGLEKVLTESLGSVLSCPRSNGPSSLWEQTGLWLPILNEGLRSGSGRR